MQCGSQCRKSLSSKLFNFLKSVNPCRRVFGMEELRDRFGPLTWIINRHSTVEVVTFRRELHDSFLKTDFAIGQFVQSSGLSDHKNALLMRKYLFALNPHERCLPGVP